MKSRYQYDFFACIISSSIIMITFFLQIFTTSQFLLETKIQYQLQKWKQHTAAAVFVLFLHHTESSPRFSTLRFLALCQINICIPAFINMGGKNKNKNKNKSVQPNQKVKHDEEPKVVELSDSEDEQKEKLSKKKQAKPKGKLPVWFLLALDNSQFYYHDRNTQSWGGRRSQRRSQTCHWTTQIWQR